MNHIQLGNWKLYYNKTGDGHLPALLLFHGFGQTHNVFEPIVNALRGQYTCYSFDLFYHGKSTAPANEVLRHEVWGEIFDLFLKKENIHEYSLLGFSLGGKFVLSAMMNQPQKVVNIYFIAPDGIKTNIWYSVATYPHLLRKFFKSLIKHPKPFFVLAGLAGKLGFLNKSLYRFVEQQMKTEAQRALVYNTWVGLRYLKYSSKEIARVLSKHNIPTELFLGRYDNVIPVKPFKSFVKKVPSATLVVLQSGHNSLIRKVAEYYSRGKRNDQRDGNLR